MTRIRYVTDGVLLREMMDDPLLTRYRWARWVGWDRGGGGRAGEGGVG